MPFYNKINQYKEEGKRTLKNLIALRKKLDKEIPGRNLDSSIILATWNIREFDSPSFSERMDEAFYYIAEIINRFDVVAIQEVRKKIDALDRLKKILGPNWEYLLTDVTEGSRGNKERMAFLYDTRKIRFGGLAGELTFPPMRMKDEEGKSYYEEVTQLARTPFLVGFHAGWTRFMVTTVHILYGQSKAEDPRRLAEIEYIAQFLKKRTTDTGVWSKNLILLGDFNIFSPKDKTFQALIDAGFEIPEELQKLPSNVKRDKFYDQIAFRVWENRFSTTGKAGVFNFFETVFTEKDQSVYADTIGERYYKSKKGKERTAIGKKRYYNMWRTHQMSDHLPMWVEIKVDYSQEYLSGKLASSRYTKKSKSTKGSKNMLSYQSLMGPDEREAAALVMHGGIPEFESFRGNAFAGEDYEDAQLSTMDMSGKSFKGANFKGANIDEGVFQESTLNGSIFDEASLQSTDFSYAEAVGVSFKEANLQKALFLETNLKMADFSGADLRECEFFECEWDGALFTGAKLSQAVKKQLKDEGADLKGAEFYP